LPDAGAGSVPTGTREGTVGEEVVMELEGVGTIAREDLIGGFVGFVGGAAVAAFGGEL
jgi:hypothetical protein